MPVSIQAFLVMLMGFLPNLLAAIIILVIGWLVAFFISKLVENLLRRTTLDDRLANMLQGGKPSRVPAEHFIALVVFWLIMLFVILIFLQTLSLNVIAGPINTMLTSVLAFLPNLFAAAILLLLAWVIATILRLVITRVFSGSMFSRRMTENANMDSRNRVSIGQTIGNVVYWLVFLLFLPAILGALNLNGILAPVSSMVNGILAALPNILGFIAILVIGWFVARIIRQIVANLLDGLGVNRLGERTGVNNVMGEQRLSDVLATIVFVLIMIPVAIAALNVLNIPAVSQPAANMLNLFLNALPVIFGAILLLVIAYFIARLVGTLVASLLSGIGFDRLFRENGPIPVTGFMTAEAVDQDVPVEGTFDAYGRPTTTQPGQVQPAHTSPSQIVGYIVMAAIIIFAIMQAAQMLGFAALTALLSSFVVLAVNVLFGLVIFGIGLYLGNQAYRMIRNTGATNAHLLAQVARIAIIVFSAALALRQMGIAQDIVNLAFGLLLGAIAVAAAIAFGIGGRDVAHQQLERWRNQISEQAHRPIPQTGGSSQAAARSSSQNNPSEGMSNSGPVVPPTPPEDRPSPSNGEDLLPPPE